MASKDATPMFLTFPVFLFPQLIPLPVFDSLAFFRQRRTEHTGYAWLIPCYGLVTGPRGRLSNQR